MSYVYRTIEIQQFKSASIAGLESENKCIQMKGERELKENDNEL